MSHQLDFEARLELERTLTAADLLLAKLQVAEVNRKDLTDTAMLLLDHELADADATGTRSTPPTSASCAAGTGGCSRPPGTTSRRSTGCGRSCPLPMADDGRLQQRIGESQQRLEQEPKSRAWKMRARIGRRKRWYEMPDEVDR